VSLWRSLMDSLWDGHLIRYLTRCKQDQVDMGAREDEREARMAVVR
jgi:hypothetical protein